MKFEELRNKKFTLANHKHLHHIVDIVNDGESKLIVYKYFGIHKRYWFYEVIEDWNFEERVKCGLIKFVDKSLGD